MKKVVFLFLVLCTNKMRSMEKGPGLYGGGKIIDRYMAAVLNGRKIRELGGLAENADRERREREGERAKEVAEQEEEAFLNLKKDGAEKLMTDFYFPVIPRLKKELSVKQENIHTLLSFVCSNSFSQNLLKIQQLIKAADLNYVHTLNKNRENEKPVTILDIVDIRLATEKKQKEKAALIEVREQLISLGACRFKDLKFED